MMLSPVLVPPVFATAWMHFGVVRRSWMPLLSIQLPFALDDELPAAASPLRHLRAEGWVNPARLLRGADMDCRAPASIDGALHDGPITVGGAGLVLFHGSVDRSPPWIDAVRSAGGIAILISAAGETDDLSALARDGLVVAAHARLFHRGPMVTAPVLRGR